MTGLQINLFDFASTPLNLPSENNNKQVTQGVLVVVRVRWGGGGGGGGYHAFKNSVFLGRTPGAVPSQI
jgi:hypothetical protein